MWDDIPTTTWPKDAIHRCRRLYRALRRPNLVRTPFGVRDFTNFGRRPYLTESVLSYVDDFYLTRVEYPSRSAIFEHFRAGFQAGSFLHKIDLPGCFSHVPVLPRDAPADGAALMLSAFAYGLRASEVAAFRMMS